MSQGRVARSLQLVELSGVRNHLSVGCGEDTVALEIAAQLGKLAIGTDISLRSLQHCVTSTQAIQSRAAAQRICYVVADARSLPFIDNSIESASMLEVIEHLPSADEPLVFAELARVLQSNRELVVSTGKRGLLSNLLDPAWALRGHRHYSSSEIRELGERAGFELGAKIEIGGVRQAVLMMAYYATALLNFGARKFRFPPIEFMSLVRSRVDRDYDVPRRSGFTLVALFRRRSTVEQESP